MRHSFKISMICCSRAGRNSCKGEEENFENRRDVSFTTGSMPGQPCEVGSKSHSHHVDTQVPKHVEEEESHPASTTEAKPDIEKNHDMIEHDIFASTAEQFMELLERPNSQKQKDETCLTVSDDDAFRPCQSVLDEPTKSKPVVEKTDIDMLGQDIFATTAEALMALLGPPSQRREEQDEPDAKTATTSSQSSGSNVALADDETLSPHKQDYVYAHSEEQAESNSQETTNASSCCNTEEFILAEKDILQPTSLEANGGCTPKKNTVATIRAVSIGSGQIELGNGARKEGGRLEHIVPTELHPQTLETNEDTIETAGYR